MQLFTEKVKKENSNIQEDDCRAYTRRYKNPLSKHIMATSPAFTFVSIASRYKPLL